MKSLCAILLIAFFSVLSAHAKTEPPIVLFWPPEKPALKLTFDKFRGQGSFQGQNAYSTDVTLENLTGKQIPHALFTVYFLDKSKVRIGQGTLQVADLDAGQSAKMQFQFNSSVSPQAWRCPPSQTCWRRPYR